jgi:hypothetical protein
VSLTSCRLLGVMNDGLIRLDTADWSYNYGKQLWSVVKTRKIAECVNCDGEISKSTNAYSPITNGYNRMHRICTTCVERMKARIL